MKRVVTIGLLTLFGVLPAGCRQCTEIGCIGGFELHVIGPDDDVTGHPGDLSPGTYLVTIDVEQGRYKVTCFVSEDQASSNCSEGEWSLAPEGDIEGRASVGGVVLDASEDMPSTRAITLGFVGSSAAPNGTNTFGPESIDVIVTRDGNELGSQSYMPTYDRIDDEAFNGPGCGFCDQQVTEQLRLATL